MTNKISQTFFDFIPAPVYHDFMPLILLILFLLFPMPAYARKKLPVKKVVANTTLPQTGLKLRADHQALLLTLSNLGQASSISYLLTYQADGVGQGAQGSADPALGNTQKELLFGTCSTGVCTYHKNITGMAFQATIGLKSGKTLVRKYAIKI